MASGYVAPLAVSSGDGPTLTAAAAASFMPVTAKYTFPPNPILLPSFMRVVAHGRISCAVTTPGTARFDIRLGSTVIADSGPMNLNVVAKASVPWWLEVYLYARAAGSTANFMSFFRFLSEAVIASPLATVGGNGEILSSVAGGPDTAPAVGNNVDVTVPNAFDAFFTQTVATGSLTCHGFILEAASVAVP